MTVYYLLGGMLMASVVLIVYSFWPSRTPGDEAIKRRMAGRRAQSTVGDLRRQAKESVAKRVVDKITPLAVRQATKDNAEQMSRLRMKLSAAGYRDENAATTFLASKTIVAVFLGAAAAAYVWANGTNLQNAVGITMIGAGLGFLAPNLWLSSAVAKRAGRGGPRPRSASTRSGRSRTRSARTCRGRCPGGGARRGGRIGNGPRPRSEAAPRASRSGSPNTSRRTPT